MATTSTRGGQIGNKNAQKPRIWSDALRKYAVQNPEELNKAVKTLFDKACDGDVSAAKEIADRLEGKAVQAVEQKTEIVGEIAVSTRPQLSKEEWLAAHNVGTTGRPAE